MSGPIKTLLDALRAHGCDPKQSGNGWLCRCPGHDDRSPSLSISEGDDGRALIFCHAGCPPEKIVRAVGLDMADLMPERPKTGRRVTETPKKPGRKRGSSDSDTPPVVYDTARDAVTELVRRHGPRAGLWTYTDPAGKPLMAVVRFPLPPDPDRPDAKPDKTFRPVSCISGRWIIGDPRGPLPLYHLPELAAKPTRVYVTEGEGVADAVRELGLVATTSPHGAKSAKRADWSPVGGIEVVILPDYDKPGERYAADVTEMSGPAGAKWIRIVRLPGLPDGGDAVDFIRARREAGLDDAAIRAEIERLVDAAENIVVVPPLPATPAFQPFPVHCLPRPIAEWVRITAEGSQTDPCVSALAIIVVIGAAIGMSRVLRLRWDWPDEPPIFWGAIVGSSGDGKSVPFRKAMAFLEAHQDEAFRVLAVESAEYDIAKQQYDAASTAWKRKPTGPPPTAPKVPVARRYTVNDSTVAALIPILCENPRGILEQKDELSGWIGSFDQFHQGKGSDRAFYLTSHRGGSATVDRKSEGRKTYHVPLAAVHVFGTIQEDTLRKMGAAHLKSGLVPRLLLVDPPVRRRRWVELPPGDKIVAAVDAMIGELLKLAPDTDIPGAWRARQVWLDDDAKAAFVSFYNEHNDARVDLLSAGEDDAAAAFSKLEAYAARLALVLHLARWACGEAVDPDKVDRASMDAAITITRWFANEARRVYGIFTETEDDRVRDRLVAWLKRNGGNATANELAHGLRAYRNNPVAAERALAELVEAGIAVWDDAKHPKGGPYTRRARLVQGVTVTETPKTTGEGRSSSDGDIGELPNGGPTP